jgi:hypothetical protein
VMWERLGFVFILELLTLILVSVGV